MLVTAIRTGLDFSETDNLLRFSHSAVCRVYTEDCGKKTVGGSSAGANGKSLVDERDQKRIAILVLSEGQKQLKATHGTDLLNLTRQFNWKNITLSSVLVTIVFLWQWTRMNTKKIKVLSYYFPGLYIYSSVKKCLPLPDFSFFYVCHT